MIFYWITYGVFVIIHLIFCFLKKRKGKEITKIFLLPFLSIALIFATNTNLFIYIALFFCWLGDLFLIFSKKEKLFISGLISFAIGHIFYIIASYHRLIQNNSFKFSAPFVLFFIIIFAILFLSSKLFFVKYLKSIAYLGALYFYLLLSLCLLNFYGNYYLSSLGFLIFIISDSIILLTKLDKHPPHEDYHIMLTYMIAQTLIVLSFM